MEFQVPVACREWAGDLAQEQDEVAQWVQLHVTREEGAALVLEDAYQSFVHEHGSSIKMRSFQKRAASVLDVPYDRRATVSLNTRKPAWIGARLD